MLDSRCGRVLTPGKRTMMDDAEWNWFVEQLSGDYEHLVIGTSLPYLLPSGLHYAEAWNEAICDGVWGSRAARVGEKLRQAIDLEHWAAFRRSFEAVAHVVIDLAAGRYGVPPTSVGSCPATSTTPTSHVLAARPVTARTRVYQAVCSPIRNPRRLRGWAIKLGMGRSAHRRPAPPGALRQGPDPPIRWRVGRHDGPWFDNVLATLDIDSRRLDLRIERAAGGRERRGTSAAWRRARAPSGLAAWETGGVSQGERHQGPRVHRGLQRRDFDAAVAWFDPGVEWVLPERQARTPARAPAQSSVSGRIDDTFDGSSCTPRSTSTSATPGGTRLRHSGAAKRSRR